MNCSLKCPKCQSCDTKKVSICDRNWHAGHQRCKNCGYQDDWGKFCELPVIIPDVNNKIIIPGIDNTGDPND